MPRRPRLQPGLSLARARLARRRRGNKMHVTRPAPAPAAGAAGGYQPQTAQPGGCCAGNGTHPGLWAVLRPGAPPDRPRRSRQAAGILKTRVRTGGRGREEGHQPRLSSRPPPRGAPAAARAQIRPAHGAEASRACARHE